MGAYTTEASHNGRQYVCVEAAATALCVMEYICDAPTSQAAAAAEKFREDNGSFELRDRIVAIGRILEEAFQMAVHTYEIDWWEIISREGNPRYFPDKLHECAGAWDFEVVPSVLNIHAYEFFANRLEIPNSRVADTLLELSAS